MKIENVTLTKNVYLKRLELCSLPYILYMQIDVKQRSYNNFLLRAKMTYKLSWKIIERKIAEPEKMIAEYFVYYQ